MFQSLDFLDLLSIQSSEILNLSLDCSSIIDNMIGFIKLCSQILVWVVDCNESAFKNSYCLFKFIFFQVIHNLISVDNLVVGISRGDLVYLKTILPSLSLSPCLLSDLIIRSSKLISESLSHVLLIFKIMLKHSLFWSHIICLGSKASPLYTTAFEIVNILIQVFILSDFLVKLFNQLMISSFCILGRYFKLSGLFQLFQGVCLTFLCFLYS